MRRVFLPLVAMLQLSRCTIRSQVEVTTLKSPLLPFQLGNTRIVENKHTFIHYVEVDKLFDQFRKFKKFYVTTEYSLKHFLQNNKFFDVTEYSILNSLLVQANHSMDILKSKLDNISFHYRAKRGLVNIVGKASKWLFGTLDADDEKRYDEAIRVLSDKQNSVKNEMALQISLTKELIDNYNASISTIISNQKLIENHTRHFEHEILETLNSYESFFLAENSVNLIIMSCQNFINFLDNLENAVMFAKLNTLHGAVIPPKMLSKLVTYLMTLYDEEKILKFENLLSFYHSVGVQVSISKSKITFALHFPILFKEIFQMFHVFPIPFDDSIIIPNHPFLVLGTNQQQEEEFECPTIEDIYICQNRLTPQLNSCISEIIARAEAQNCHPVKVHIENSITAFINHEYSILVPALSPIKLNKICNKSEYEIIKEASIVKIPKGCQIIADEFHVSNNQEIVQGDPFILPELKMMTTNTNRTRETPLKLKSINLDEIRHLKQMAELLRVPDDTQIHPLAWSLMSMVPMVAIIIIIYVAARRLYRKKRDQPREGIVLQGVTLPENKSSVLFSS